MTEKKYDFAGYVSKNDTLCSDGVVIRQGAFADQDGAKVPLVWQHNHDNPSNVIGHVVLKNRDEGVYGFGYLNDGPQAKSALEDIRHGDIDSMSIYANRIKRQGPNVTHGKILEVSLVLKGANPGALIDSVTHSDGSVNDEEAILYSNNLIHLEEDEPGTIKHSGGSEMDKDTTKETPAASDDTSKGSDGEETVGSVLDTLSPKQKQAVEILLGEATKGQDDSDAEDDDSSDDTKKDNVQQSDNGGKAMTKHNVFDDNGEELKHSEEGTVLSHSEVTEIFKEGFANRERSFKQMLATRGTTVGDTIQHSIQNVEVLFPDAKTTGQPSVLFPTNTAAQEIINGVTKSPIARVKTIVADLTEDDARARGYIKGKEKLEQVYPLLTRTTDPQTIYKKQKLERDDIIDSEEMDIVAFTNSEMKNQLTEEMARAILVGDGRPVTDPSHIREDRIRPIVSDAPMFTGQVVIAQVADFLEGVINVMSDYQGSGNPTMYIDPKLLAKVRLVKATDGRYLFGNGGIPSTAEIAAQLEVAKIVPTVLMPKGEAVIVNLADYGMGASKGGQVTTFEDFDIDFNEQKYLIETRVSGALTKPKSAIHIVVSENFTSVGDGGFSKEMKSQADTDENKPAGDGQ